MILKKLDMFNKNSICIFTDASYTNFNGTNSVCSGACVYFKDLLIDQTFDIMHNSTVQKGELHAILLGVQKAFEYRNYKSIRIFSDSQTSIFAIRDRIFNWIRRNKNENILGEDGTIQNLEFIMDIIYEILSNGIRIEFYHVKGHVKTNDYDSIKNAKKVFMESNHIAIPVEDELIYSLAIGNDQVDRYTGYMLENHYYDQIYNTSNLTKAVSIGYAPFNVSKYHELVRKEDKYTNVCYKNKKLHH